MTEDPGPHKVYIDNIKLVVKDASNSIEMQGLPEYSRVNINQIGYKPEDEKIVFIKDQHNKVVYDVYN
jgi:endoglucanase